MLLIFLLAILIPAYASTSPAFHMMYSAYKLNKQGDNIQPWRTCFWGCILSPWLFNLYAEYVMRNAGDPNHCQWPKITADGDCSHKIKRHLLLERKVMTNLDSILKSRDITLPKKVHLVKAMVFPAVMYGCESWTIKKAECQRIDVFELWCWRRLLRVPWIARRSNQSILKEISPAYSLVGVMLKLKLQCFGHLMQRAVPLENTWCWERLKAGEGDDRRWGGWTASPTWWTWVWASSRSWSRTEKLVYCSPWGLKESDMTERLKWA